MQGFLNINKPAGITSHTAVSKIRKITGIKQIGHAGTLDPAASGVLPIAIGKAAKLIDYLPSDKRYTAVIEFGKRSDTCDLEGNIEIIDAPAAALDRIEKALSLFRGEIKQTPPAYSAVHYNGKRLYELAREGKIPDDIPSRTVTVYKNEIIDFDEKTQKLTLDIFCSKGTYIRSIARDLGETLKTGALLFSLIRTEAAGMKLENALTLDETLTAEIIEKNLINPAAAVSLKSFEITAAEFERIKHGNCIKNRFNAADKILLIYNGAAAALASARPDALQPEKLLQSFF